jgi:hypothetical protein
MRGLCIRTLILVTRETTYALGVDNGPRDVFARDVSH